MTSAELIKLAARVEALQGPCREVDAEVALAFGWRKHEDAPWWKPPGERRWTSGPPPMTASMDAAATLVPEGFWLRCGKSSKGAWAELGPDDGTDEMGDFWQSSAATPVLALCAAALRARAAIADGEPT